jgi:hypothetical protein
MGEQCGTISGVELGQWFNMFNPRPKHYAKLLGKMPFSASSTQLSVSMESS